MHDDRGPLTGRAVRGSTQARCRAGHLARLLPRDVRLRPRPVPGGGLPGAGGREGRAGRRPDRIRQDDRRRVRRAPRPRAGQEVLLHHAHQGAVQPEVRRPVPPLRHGQGRPAHRRQQRQLRRPRGRDDHRGPAEHAVRRVADPAGPRLRGDGRGALPLRPLPGRRLGGSDHPPPGVGDAGLPVGDGVQRRGVRRLAGHRPRGHRGDRLRAPARAAVPARAGNRRMYDLFEEGGATRRPSTPT